ncbi:hypothetical protein K1719_041590 [Acacia pycnantha]|nr:hypothetical protein K1719_041590 [Acacia pycnantha]
MDPTCGLVDGLVGKFRDLVVDLSWEQLLYFLCYDRNIDQLNGQHMELTLERSSIQHQIDEAKNNGEQIEEKVLHWLRKVDRLSEQKKREDNEGIDSRVPIMNQILKELRNPSVNMIGLCGLGGVGKTTIAKEVAKNQNIFKKVIMATVSQELNIEKIQGQIAEKLSMQLSENNRDVSFSSM